MCERRWSQEQSLATGIFGRHSRIVERIELLLKPGREFSSHVSMRRIVWSCAVVIAIAAGSSRAPHLVAFAQQAERPSFEVASIKLGDPNGRPKGIGVRGSQFGVWNASLKLMIQFAYNVQDHQIFGGPKWIDSDLFTIDARPSASTPEDEEERQRLRNAAEARHGQIAGTLKEKEPTLANAEALVQNKQWTFDDFRRFLQEAGVGIPDQDTLAWLLRDKMGLPTERIVGPKMFPLMLQSLLEERFKVALHRETRMEPIYELVVAKGGLKLKDTAGPDANGRFGFFCRGQGLGPCTSNNSGIGALVGMLSSMLGRPVRDKTGLTGKYDFTLTFTPEPTQPVPGASPPEAPPTVDSNAPSIFTALQEQLGLKLESARGPVEVLVIDNAERPEPN
jgi:uncharacterized protein (TIGR03435 family)